MLLLERDQFSLPNSAIARELEKQRPRFPLLAAVDVWIAETHESGDIAAFEAARPDGKYDLVYCFAGNELKRRRDGL